MKEMDRERGLKRTGHPDHLKDAQKTVLKMKKQQAHFLAGWPLVIRNGIAEVAIHDGK